MTNVLLLSRIVCAVHELSDVVVAVFVYILNSPNTQIDDFLGYREHSQL